MPEDYNAGEDYAFDVPSDTGIYKDDQPHSPHAVVDGVLVRYTPDTNEDAPDAPDNLPEGIDLTLLSDEERAGYLATLKISEEAAPILNKIAAGASLMKNATSIRLKARDCWRLMTWLTTIQNVADMQQQRIEAADVVIASQADALAKYEEGTGKKLWRPGPMG